MKNTKIKIIGLPWAGASGYCYRMFEEYVPKNFEWVTYELPGRGNRIGEGLLTNIEDMAEDLYSKVTPHIKNSPFIIYGHSMGTILGYELLRKILIEKGKEPIFVFLTGRHAPSVPEKEKLSELESNMFWQKINEKGGLPEEIINNPELKDFLEPVLKADFKAIENYKYSGLKNKFEIPLNIGLGIEEIVESKHNKIDWKGILAWQELTNCPIDVKFYYGNHFFITKHSQKLISYMINSISTVNNA